MGWAIKWHNGLQGATWVPLPAPFAGYSIMVFRSKAAAAAYIKVNWGYIATRRDLRSPPHNWRMPKPVKVTVTVKENGNG